MNFLKNALMALAIFVSVSCGQIIPSDLLDEVSISSKAIPFPLTGCKPLFRSSVSLTDQQIAQLTKPAADITQDLPREFSEPIGAWGLATGLLLFRHGAVVKADFDPNESNAKMRQLAELTQPVPIDPVTEIEINCIKAMVDEAKARGYPADLNQLFSIEKMINIEISPYAEPKRIKDKVEAILTYRPDETKMEYIIETSQDETPDNCDSLGEDIRTFKYTDDPLDEKLYKIVDRSFSLRFQPRSIRKFEFYYCYTYLMDTAESWGNTQSANFMRNQAAFVKSEYLSAVNNSRSEGVVGVWEKETPFESQAAQVLDKIIVEMAATGLQFEIPLQTEALRERADRPDGVRNPEYLIPKQDALIVSLALLDAAQIAYTDGDKEGAEELFAVSKEALTMAIEIGRCTADIAVSLSPFGRAKDITEAITGLSLIPDFRELTTLERTIAAVGAVTTGGGALRAISSGLKKGRPLKWFGRNFKPGLFEAPFEKIVTIRDSAKSVGIGQRMLKPYVRVFDPIKSLPQKFQQVRVRLGDHKKVALIGRKMDSIDEAEEILKKQDLNVETFQVDNNTWKEFMAVVEKYRNQVGDPTAMLPTARVYETNLYKLNKEWAEKLRSQNYTVIDIGNPNGDINFSAFYGIENLIIFPK